MPKFFSSSDHAQPETVVIGEAADRVLRTTRKRTKIFLINKFQTGEIIVAPALRQKRALKEQATVPGVRRGKKSLQSLRRKVQFKKKITKKTSLHLLTCELSNGQVGGINKRRFRSRCCLNERGMEEYRLNFTTKIVEGI